MRNIRYFEGFTFFGLLFAVVLIGFALTGASMVWQVQQQRYKEQQLLYIGKQYQNAIASYYTFSPGGARQYPPKLSDLLRDPRYPTIRRHIRKLWRDPLANNSEWGLIIARQGGIVGVYSRAPGKPLMQPVFEKKKRSENPKAFVSYAQWKFVHPDGLTADELQHIYGQDKSGKTLE